MFALLDFRLNGKSQINQFTIETEQEEDGRWIAEIIEPIWYLKKQLNLVIKLGENKDKIQW
jgi:hypothetical protein